MIYKKLAKKLFGFSSGCKNKGEWGIRLENLKILKLSVDRKGPCLKDTCYMAGVVGGDIAENKDESYSAKDWQDVTAFV